MRLKDLQEQASSPKNQKYGRGKKVLITTIGFSVLFAGIAMVVLPGPAIVVIPVGLGILAKVYDWPKKALVRVKKKAHQIKSSLAKKRSRKPTV